MAEFEDRQFYQYPPFNPIIPAPVWGKDAEYAVPVVSSVGNGPAGPKGEDGGYIPFDELTDEQLEKIYMGASACHTYSTDAYVLTTGTQTQRITIPIEDISEYDLLCVDVEGLDLVEGTDYTFMDDYIVLNQPITHPNTRVHFKAISYQLADGDRTMNVTRVVNEVKPMFANPVEYAGTSTYPAMTIVKYNGAYYVSKNAVPIWTSPDNAEFWQLTFLYDDIIAVDAGGTGADNAEDARENLGITPANIGAATQGDMDDAEAAIGDVDVEEDGSLQEQVTALKNEMDMTAWETVPTTGYPSGASGTIRHCTVGKIAFVQFDGFKLNSSSWATIATGLPKAVTNAAWFTMATDSTQNTMKAQISTSGVLQMRLGTTGTNINVDCMISYPCQ